MIQFASRFAWQGLQSNLATGVKERPVVLELETLAIFQVICWPQRTEESKEMLYNWNFSTKAGIESGTWGQVGRGRSDNRKSSVGLEGRPAYLFLIRNPTTQRSIRNENKRRWFWQVRKVRLQIKYLGQKVTGSKLGASKDSLLWNLRWNVPFLFWFVNTISIHLWDALVDCTFALNVRDVTWAQ